MLSSGTGHSGTPTETHNRDQRLRGFLTTLGSLSVQGKVGTPRFPGMASFTFHWPPEVILTTVKKKLIASTEPNAAIHSPAVSARSASLPCSSPAGPGCRGGYDRESHILQWWAITRSWEGSVCGDRAGRVLDVS